MNMKIAKGTLVKNIQEMTNEELIRFYNQCIHDRGIYYNLQISTKTILNSAYGACANEYFRFFNLENAEAITKTGQLIIRWIELKLNEYLNSILKTDDDYVIIIDTDSVYVCFDKLVKSVFGEDESDIDKIIDFLDKLSETKIEPFIEKSYAELYDYLNGCMPTLVMKREAISSATIAVAKKRYIMNVYDNEGVRYKEPHIKMTGIEAVRSSTPAVCRDYIVNTLKLILNSNEPTMQKYIREVREEFKTLPFDKVSFPRKVSFHSNGTNPDGSRKRKVYEKNGNMFTKGTPIQVKGALLYNEMLRSKNLDKKYPLIEDGEKIKFSYLLTPNPTHNNVISCPEYLPTEFAIESYIDYDTQFDKAFIGPIDNILSVIGWSHEKRPTLMDFFE